METALIVATAVILLILLFRFEGLLVRRLLTPACLAVDYISKIFFLPFSWLMRGLTYIFGWLQRKPQREQLIGSETTAFPKKTVRFSQMMKLFFWMLLFVVIFGVVKFRSGYTGDLEKDVVLSLPVFTLPSLFFESVFSYEALVQLSLFSVFSMDFMRRNNCENEILASLYDITFTALCACLLCVIPDAVYTFPLKAVPFLKTFAASYSGQSVLSVAVSAVALLGLIVVAYIIMSSYLLAVRELLASVTYSLMPFTSLVVIIGILLLLNLGDLLTAVCCIIITMIFTVRIGAKRIHHEKMQDEAFRTSQVMARQQRLAKRAARREARQLAKELNNV